MLFDINYYYHRYDYIIIIELLANELKMREEAANKQPSYPSSTTSMDGHSTTTTTMADSLGLDAAVSGIIYVLIMNSDMNR